MTERLVPPATSVRPDAPAAGFTVRPAVLWGVVLLLGALALVPRVRDQVAQSVTRAPEPFTALAFADPAAPLDCARGTAVATVANRTGRDRTYAYTLSLTPAGASTPARTVQREVTVAAGEQARFRIGPGRPLTAGTRLSLSLAGSAQEIHATCAGAGS